MIGFDFIETLSHAVYIVRRHGFINADMAMVNGVQPTNELILDSLICDNEIDLTVENALAIEIRDWLLSPLSGNNDFMDSAKKLINDSIKSKKDIGILGATVNVYQMYLQNKPMIEKLMTTEFSNKPLGKIKSNIKDLKLYYIGTIYSNGKVRECYFKTCDSQLVVLYKRKDLSESKTGEYYYNGAIKKTDFKFESIVTVLQTHRHDIKVK